MGLGKASLLRDIDGERFVNLLAGLAAMGDRGTQRFVEVYRRFAPVSQSQDILSLVRSRLSQDQGQRVSAEVWKTVETLILNLTENPFMDAEYSDSLEFLMVSSGSTSLEEETPILLEAPEHYLDHLILAMSVEEEDYFQKRLIDRIKMRTEQLGPLGVLGFVRVVDQTLPKLLDGRPYFVKDLFQKGLSVLARASFAERQALIHFAVDHERCLLDTILNVLIEEKKISTRYYLVNLLSCFSLAATPAFVSKSRTGPWYVARNLAIVLGQQGFPQVLPPLRALSNHTHPKVKKEAVKALRRVESSLNNLPKGTGRGSVDCPGPSGALKQYRRTMGQDALDYFLHRPRGSLPGATDLPSGEQAG